jgi:hypothetical protein
MAEIQVSRLDPDRLRVEVGEGRDSTVHEVTVTSNDVERFAPGSSPEALVEESFRFLLEREPKESILSSFELPLIARNFPEYPDQIRRRMGS